MALWNGPKLPAAACDTHRRGSGRGGLHSAQAQSLIADHFTRADTPASHRALLMGNPLSLLIGYFLAGWLNELYGWRVTFALLGLPGLALAALAWLTLRSRAARRRCCP